MWDIDAGERIVGQQFHFTALGARLQGPTQPQTGHRAAMAARVDKDCRRVAWLAAHAARARRSQMALWVVIIWRFQAFLIGEGSRLALI